MRPALGRPDLPVATANAKDAAARPAALAPAQPSSIHAALQIDLADPRIVRVRDRSTRMEVARGFAADPDRYAERISGLFRFSDRVFYSINPRSDQMQTPLSMTKLDPDVLNNLTAQVANPVPIEICIAFQQPTDDPATLATLTSKTACRSL